MQKGGVRTTANNQLTVGGPSSRLLLIPMATFSSSHRIVPEMNGQAGVSAEKSCLVSRLVIKGAIRAGRVCGRLFGRIWNGRLTFGRERQFL